MKTKFIISILLGLSALSFVINNKTTSINGEAPTPVSPAQTGWDTTFLIGALDDGWDQGYQRMDELGFNVWHKYIGKNLGWTINGAPNDSLFTDISIYGPQVKAILDTNKSHNLNSVMMRPKVTFLYYGKRSDYQCEPISSNDDLWFYSFNISKEGTYIENIPDYTHGNGAMVKWCHGDPADAPNRADTIVKRLKANTEQCNTWADIPDGDSPLKNWIIKPRIRIDSTIADNPANLNTNVCKVIVNGETKTGADTILKSSNIKVINFLNNQGNYDGNYMEEYFSFSSNDSLTINGLWGQGGGNRARGNHTIDTGWSSKIDIQVYWYGNCDMWIDYVRVDNMVAHDLLSNDTTNQTFNLYQNWLQWEAQDIACHNDSPIKFYVELFDFSNIPCMAYVSRMLDSIAFNSCSKHITLTGLLSEIYSFVVPYENRFSVMNNDHIIRNYVDRVGLSDILIPCYPFFTNKQSNIPYTETTFAKIPNTLPSTDGSEVLANAIPPSEYDDWLQDNMDHSPYYYEPGSNSTFPHDGNAFQHEGAFRWAMEMGDAISKAKDIPFLYNGQSHLWYYAEGESHKEPTNEEMEMIANVSLTYGVRGLLYFFYGWWNGPDPSEMNKYCLNNECFGRGFANPGNIPRYFNAYGQDKWEMIKSQVVRMKTWEPYIMSFDNINRKTYIVRNEISDLKNETYFNDILSYQPDPYDFSIPVSLAEPIGQRYLQAAVFENPAESYSKYFMVVNRRCSPYDSLNAGNTNGGRFVTIRLDADSTEFALFNSWKIIDLKDNSTVSTFDKRSISTNYLKWYLPGEGKLYKIAPVMLEGGTLVADEDVIGNFDCKGEVNNNGKNITLRPGTTINFINSDARIIMNGGDFKSGINTGDNTAPVNLQGKDTVWKGIVLQDCQSVEMYKTYFKDISPYEI